jgi:hypothetical protein
MTKKTTSFPVILAAILLLSTASFCQVTLTIGKALRPNYNLVKDDIVKIGLADVFVASSGTIEYDLGATNTFLSVQGISNKVSQGELVAGSPIKDCSNFLSEDGYIVALCNGGKTVHQIRVDKSVDAQGNPTIKTPDFFKKKSNGELVKFDIPAKTGETLSECHNLTKSLPNSSSNYIYQVSCKYVSNKISHYIFKIGTNMNAEEGLVFDGPSANDIQAFDADDNTEKSKELDAIYTYNLTGELSGENKDFAVAHDTFLNQDFIIGEQKKQKVGYWIYSVTKTNIYLGVNDRTFVPFDTLKQQTDDNKMDANFRLTYALAKKSSNNLKPHVMLLGYIPGPNDIGGKFVVYLVEHTYDSNGATKFKDFKIILKNDTTNLDESFGSLKFMTSMVNYASEMNTLIVFVQTYKKFQVLSFKEFLVRDTETYKKMFFSTPFATATPAYQYPTAIMANKFIISGLMSRGDSKKLNSAIVTNIVSLSSDESKEALPSVFLLLENGLIGFEGTTYKFYVPQMENTLVIDTAKHPGNSVTVPIKANIKGSTPPVTQTISVVFNKMATWNERADVGTLTFNQVNSYGAGWVNIPIGGESLEGNGAAVEVDIAGVDKANIQNLMADLSKLKLTYLTNKEIQDGFLPLNNVNPLKKQIFIAFKHKTGTFAKNMIWFFNCNFEKKECTEYGKGATFPDNFRVTSYGWSNED